MNKLSKRTISSRANSGGRPAISSIETRLFANAAARHPEAGPMHRIARAFQHRLAFAETEDCQTNLDSDKAPESLELDPNISSGAGPGPKAVWPPEQAHPLVALRPFSTSLSQINDLNVPTQLPARVG